MNIMKQRTMQKCKLYNRIMRGSYNYKSNLFALQ